MDRQSSQTASENYQGMISLLYEKYSHYPRIELQFDVWEGFKNHHGKVEYYFFGGGTKHGGLCFRIPKQDVVAQAELVVHQFDKETKWFVLCREGEWRPKEEKIYMSTYDWHMGTILKVAHDFAKFFKNYHTYFNNCNDWKYKLVEYMRENGPPDVQIPNSLEELMILAKDFGTELIIMQKAIGNVQEHE